MSPLPPLSPDERLRSVGLVAFRAGPDRELLHNEHTGAARLLTYDDGDLLAMCRVFKTARQHAADIARETGRPETAVPALASQLSLLARSGLLVRKSQLLDRLRSAPPADEPLHVVPPGADFNTVLRETRGRRVLFGDGLLRGGAAGPPAFSSEPRLADGPPGAPSGAVREAHARVLGASPASLAEGEPDLDGLDARLLRRLRLGDGIVAATQHGGPALHADRLIVTNRPVALDGPLGLDNRLPLPPAPALAEGAREVFLLVLRKVHERALFALLPGVAEAPAPPPPRGTRAADVLLALLSPFEVGPFRPDGLPRTLALAAHLRRTAALPAEDFHALVLSLLRRRARPEDRLAVEVPAGARDVVRDYSRLLERGP